MTVHSTHLNINTITFIMNISDYSVESLDHIHNIVDSYYQPTIMDKSLLRDYILTFQDYINKDKSYEDRYTTFAEAIETAKQIDVSNYTRHSSVLSAVHHMDNYFDLYNEAAIKVVRSKD